jgi:hypothetical protein
MIMPARNKAAAETAEQRDPPGKPQSQIDAEAPPDAGTAAAQAAEYESRVPAAMYETGEPAAATGAAEDEPGTSGTGEGS